jgi:cystathionine beta-lyase
MSFDEIIDRHGTHSVKWDAMEAIYGVPASDGISMWVADMDFRPPQCISDAVAKMHEHGVYGYYGDDAPYREAICWWMKSRHGWDVDPAGIFTTHGLVNGTAMCVDAFTNPGEGVVLFTPVYHAFAKVISAAGRTVVECEMNNIDGCYELDFDAYDAQMTGNETMLVFCSPHNPSGRVWSKGELQAVAAFAKRHELILVSDEIHHDLVFE